MLTIQIQVREKDIIDVQKDMYTDIFGLGLKSFKILRKQGQQSQQHSHNQYLCDKLATLQQMWVQQQSNNTILCEKLNKILSNPQRTDSIAEIDSKIMSLQQMCIQQQSANSDLNEKMNKILMCPQKKGSFAEMSIINILSHQFPEFIVKDMTKEPKSGDIHLICDKFKLMIELKHYNNTIPSTEIDKFTRDVQDSECNGFIFVAIGQRISNKPKIQLEISQNRPVLYIADFNQDQIQSLISAILLIKELGNKQTYDQNIHNAQIQNNIIKQTEINKKYLNTIKKQLEKHLKLVVQMINSHSDIINSAKQ